MCGYGAGETGKHRFCGGSQLRRCGSTEGSQPFVPGCRGGSALLGSRDEAHWQVKGGSHYRVKDEVPWRVEGSRPIRSRAKRLAQGKLMLASTCTGYCLAQVIIQLYKTALMKLTLIEKARTIYLENCPSGKLISISIIFTFV